MQMKLWQLKHLGWLLSLGRQDFRASDLQQQVQRVMQPCLPWGLPRPRSLGARQAHLWHQQQQLHRPHMGMQQHSSQQRQQQQQQRLQQRTRQPS